MYSISTGPDISRMGGGGRNETGLSSHGVQQHKNYVGKCSCMNRSSHTPQSSSRWSDNTWCSSIKSVAAVQHSAAARLCLLDLRYGTNIGPQIHARHSKGHLGIRRLAL